MADGCPACGGNKTPRAHLCQACRRRAIEVGVAAVIRAHTVKESADPDDQITPGQIRALHGKAARLDRLNGRARRETHDAALAHATQLFGRQVSSVKDLDQLEANLILDWLDEDLVAVEIASAPA